LPAGVVLDDRFAEGLRQATASGHGVSVLCRGEEAHAFLTFIHDDGREGADGLVQALYRQGVNVEILSGDLQSAVDAFAQKVGMPNGAAHGGLSPEQKVRFVEERGQTHVTMMVGDGFNDAGALAKADVGVAVGTGEQVNLDAADVLIPGDDPRMVSTLVKMARSAQRTLAFNLMFSIGITVVLVFAVINGWYDQLWVGVLVHEMSVIVVILNGARLAGADGWLDLLRGTFRALLDDVRVSLKLVAARWTS
jgi:Cd2+/Zn2+-exporting ATPase